MPVYGKFVPQQSAAPGVVTPMWTAETPTPGTSGAAASHAVGLVRTPAGKMPIAIHGNFSGAPGTFEIDLQVADTDAEAQYITVNGGIINSVDANQNFHFEFPNLIGRFVRLLLRARGNSVSVTATLIGG